MTRAAAVVLLVSICLAMPKPAATVQASSSFYLQGALIHRVTPAVTTRRFPVIMVPGLNLSSYIFLTTPDGRKGWAQLFADAGHDVYVVNDPRFDFSRGFSVPGFEDVPTLGAPDADPRARPGWQQDIWRRWGLGPSEGVPYPDSRFPSASFPDFADHYPRVSRSSTSLAEATTALLAKTGPAVLLAHSAGGPQGLAAARTHPTLVAGIVLVEPTGPPTATDFPALAGIAMLGVYADYIESRRQTGRKAGVERAAALFEQSGGIGDVISLPDDYDVRGNSHVMMQDSNNAFIADLIIDWLARHASVPGSVTAQHRSPQVTPAAGTPGRSDQSHLQNPTDSSTPRR